MQSIPTPALLVDLDILEHNIRAMADKARALGVRLRPHVKTHKCLEIGRLQKEHGAQGVTVSTLVEAKDFADGGFDDITWAFPLVIGRLPEVIALARRITFRVLVDSLTAARALAEAAQAAGIAVHVFLEVDCGYHRSGADPAQPATMELARYLAGTQGLVFDGILTHGGHGYHVDDRAALLRAARDERDNMVAFAEKLRRAGVTVPTVSIGSTPTMAAHEDLTGVDEVRPGSYVFHDWMQVAEAVCTAEEVAASVLASVVSHQPGSSDVIVDAGALAMSKDVVHAKDGRGYGPLYAGLAGTDLEPRVHLRALSQEHGFVAGKGIDDVQGRFAVGELVRIMPIHCCLTAAMFDQYHVVKDGAVVATWPIRRGR